MSCVKKILPKISVPILLNDFLKDSPKWVKTLLCFDINPPIYESFQNPPPQIDYNSSLKALSTEFVKMFTSYYTDNTFDLHDKTKECTVVAFRCSDDDTKNCCEGKSTLNRIYLACLDNTVQTQTKYDIYICELSLDVLEVDDASMKYRDDKIECKVTLFIEFTLNVFVEIADDVSQSLCSLVTVFSCDWASQETTQNYLLIGGSCKCEVSVPLRYSLQEPNSTILSPVQGDDVVTKLIETSDTAVYSDGSSGSKCLLNCINAFFDQKPSAKTDMNDKVYQTLIDQMSKLFSQEIKRLISQEITIPIYCIPESFFGEDVTYQDFFSILISNQNPSNFVDLQTCQNNTPMIKIQKREDGNFACQETRQGSGCAIAGSFKNTQSNVKPLELGDEITLLYQDTNMRDRCRSYYDKDYTHTDWSISCGGLPYIENKINIDPCKSKNLDASLNDNNLLSLRCNPFPTQRLTPYQDLFLKRFMFSSKISPTAFLGANIGDGIFASHIPSILCFYYPHFDNAPQYVEFQGCIVPTSAVFLTNPYPDGFFHNEYNLLVNYQFQLLIGSGEDINSVFMVFEDVTRDENDRPPIFKDFYGNDVHWDSSVVSFMNDPLVMEFSTSVPGFKYYQPQGGLQAVVYNYMFDGNTATTSIDLMGLPIDTLYLFSCQMIATPTTKSHNDQFSGNLKTYGTYQCVTQSGDEYKYEMNVDPIDGGIRFSISGIQYPETPRLSEGFVIQIFLFDGAEVCVILWGF